MLLVVLVTSGDTFLASTWFLERGLLYPADRRMASGLERDDGS